MYNNHNNHAGIALLLVGAWLPLSVLFAFLPQAKAQSPRTEVLLEKVKVSARRHQQPPQQVPVAASIIDAEANQQMAIGTRLQGTQTKEYNND